jgi:nicotinamidase-related amidase
VASTGIGPLAKGSRSALLLVDFINLFDFPGSELLASRAVPAARNAARLKARIAKAGLPCIYANDNYGDWHSEFSALVRKCRGKGGASAAIARALAPTKRDLCVLKPRHSAFFGTPLSFLLDELKVRSLTIVGLSADICVLATAHDAHVRKYKVWVPSDCVAADTAQHEAEALEIMRRTLEADIRPSVGTGASTRASR